MAYETVNRGWLKRQVQKGSVVCVESYSFDDMHGAERTRTERPVEFQRLDENGRRLHTEGVIALDDYHFTGKSGRAWRNGELITLIVHSNLHYTLKLKS